MGKPTTPRSRYRLLASALVNRARGAELCSSRDLPSGRRRPERLVTASRDQIRPERVRRPTACGRGVFQTAAVRANRGRTMSGVQATQRSRSRLWLSHPLGKSAARQSREPVAVSAREPVANERACLTRRSGAGCSSSADALACGQTDCGVGRPQPSPRPEHAQLVAPRLPAPHADDP
jgi:hypothetical protein